MGSLCPICLLLCFVYGVRVFENMRLRSIFGPRIDK
jgi:hypothetical protein